MKGVPAERRARVVVRECAAAYAILVVFMLGGRKFMEWLTSRTSRRRSRRIILFLIAIRMVFPRPEGIFGDRPAAKPFLVPACIPSIAGPSALGDGAAHGSRDPAKITSWIMALTVAMAVTTFVLAAADRLQRWLGERAMIAFERLMGSC